MAKSEIELALEAVATTFAAYRSPGSDFCSFCYDGDEIAYLLSCAVSEIDAEHARKLLWETADHWGSSEVYRHYLPRILRAIAPPEACEDLYPEHLFEVLAAQGFAAWPDSERKAVLRFLDAMTNAGALAQERDARAWADETRKLRGPHLQLP